MQSVELFVGAGGLALGLSNSGFVPSVLIEKDSHSCQTIRSNKLNDHFGMLKAELYEGDIAEFTYDCLKKDIALVSGGPPCQPFSIGGKHKGFNDKRDMFPEAIRSVRALTPKCFIFENVKGLNRKTFSNYKEYIRLQLTYPEIVRKNNQTWVDHLKFLEMHHTSSRHSGLEYNVIVKLLNAANYGVPQKRERLFFVGFRADLGIEWSFPEETHSESSLLISKWIKKDYWELNKISKKNIPEIDVKIKSRLKSLCYDCQGIKPWKTVREAINGLPDPESQKNAHLIPNHEFRKGARVYNGHTGSPLDEPAKTIKAGDHGVPGGENMLVKSDGSVRYFTVRESARLQTFPDDYLFYGSWTESMRQLGNAVPVMLAEKIGKSIITKLESISIS